MKKYFGFNINKENPLLQGLAVFVMIFVLTQYLSYQSYVASRNGKQNECLKEINAVRVKLKTVIDNGLSATKTLSFIIKHYGVPKDFDQVAKEILESNNNIDALELTQKGLITNVYPLVGNEKAIGYNILEDPLRSSEAIKAIEKKSLYFAGPLNLKQGGIAVVGRLPIFIDDDFFGFSIAIIKLSTLLNATGINTNQNNRFNYQLSKVNPVTRIEEFFLTMPVPIDEMNSATIDIPDGEWKLYVMQKNDKIPSTTIVFCLLGFILASISGLFTWYLAKQPGKLKKLVDEKTEELISKQNLISESESRLVESQAVAKVGSWETNLIDLTVIWSKETFKVFEFPQKDSTIVHQDFMKFVHPEDVDKVDQAFKNSFKNTALNVIEHRIITFTGKTKFIEERWRLYQDKNGVMYKAVGTCQDITERKEAENAVKESEKKYKYLFENNPLPMFVWDFETLKIIDCNEEALIKYGYSRNEFLKLTIRDIRPEEDIPMIENVVVSESIYKETYKKIWRHKKKSGELMLVNITAHLINSEGRKVSIVLLDDVTEKLKVEEEIKSSYKQLQELTAHLQIIREEERTRIAREIHDELGQQLTGLKMDAAWINKKVVDNLPVKDKLISMISLIDETVKTVRRISSELRPGILDDLGLVPALEWLGQEFEKRSGLVLQFHTELNELNLQQNISTNIFRIYQEALTNIARHAQATKVETTFEKIHDNIELRIKDNGLGFDTAVVKNKRSLGLVGMKERALLIKGTLKIESETNKGTCIILTVPWTEINKQQ